MAAKVSHPYVEYLVVILDDNLHSPWLLRAMVSLYH